MKIQKNHHGFRRYKDEIEIVIKKINLRSSPEKKMFEAEYNRSKILKITGLESYYHYLNYTHT